MRPSDRGQGQDRGRAGMDHHVAFDGLAVRPRLDVAIDLDFPTFVYEGTRHEIPLDSRRLGATFFPPV